MANDPAHFKHGIVSKRIIQNIWKHMFTEPICRTLDVASIENAFMHIARAALEFTGEWFIYAFKLHSGSFCKVRITK